MSEESGKAVFLTKKQREEQALLRLQQKRAEEESKKRQELEAHQRFVSGRAGEEKRQAERLKREREDEERSRRQKEENIGAAEQDHELKSIKDHYLGGGGEKKRVVKSSDKFARTFNFEWEATDDTGKDDLNPLYSKRMKINALFGRGYIAGVDTREQRKESNFLLSLSEKRLMEAKKLEEANEEITEEEKQLRERQRQVAIEDFKRSQAEEWNRREADEKSKLGRHWTDKQLSEMTERDWRIFREDFDIRLQGGHTILPLRYWNEAPIPEPIYRAIQAAGYEKPSPIQRQAIPVSLMQRDMIGIAETGSGKTCAFIVPLLAYLLRLPAHFRERCQEEGPIAIVMAPTRELAQGLESECVKLAQFTTIRSAAVVGGQDIEAQGMRISQGVEIVIGTPGRMLDCIRHHYMVLNQCHYVILDEADRMIDMGFDDQVEAILQQMGGLLKSDDENQAEQQRQELDDARTAQRRGPLYRITTMFTATMSSEVELIAKQYLRHPIIVRIGDVDTGKNKRIDQHVLFLTEAQKKNTLQEEINKILRNFNGSTSLPSDHRNSSNSSSTASASAEPSRSSGSSSSSKNSSTIAEQAAAGATGAQAKIIVFVNTQKTGDNVTYQLEQQGHWVGLLHGGKSQDQREETLELFRAGRVQILVATDVAGRGLDIPDVSHVINYDTPKKIANYSHRIGRTGRAGKFGVAITFVTDADAEVMFDLRQYLESTQSTVPKQLAMHPAAQAAPGARDDKGRLLGQKKDTISYLK